MQKISFRSNCLINVSLEIWGDKWSLLIIRDLMFFNKHSFGEFAQSAEKIATNILAARLSALENNGIIDKCTHPHSKAKIWYQLTEKGIDLLPLLIEISIWAEQFATVPESLGGILSIIKADKQAFITQQRQLLLAQRLAC